MRVTDRTGQTWQVGRKWLPWKRRIRKIPVSDWLDLAHFSGGDGPISTAIGLICLAVALVVLVPTVLALLGVVIEVALLLALVPLVVVVRTALGRPWTVQVIGPDRAVRHREQVVGWRASGERIRRLGEQIRAADRESPAL